MKLVDLVNDIVREIPTAPMRGFNNLLKLEMERLYNAHSWSHYLARTTFVVPEVYESILVTGSTNVDVVLPSSYLVQAALDGTTVTITDGIDADYTYTFNVNSAIANTVHVINTTTFRIPLWEGADGVCTITFQNRADWRLPVDFSNMEAITSNDGRRCYDDPRNYTFDNPTSDARQILVWTIQPSGLTLVVDYFRVFTPATNPNDTLDIPLILERPLFIGCMSKLLSKMRSGVMEDPMRAQHETYIAEYPGAIKDAKGRDVLRRNATQVNMPRATLIYPRY